MSDQLAEPMEGEAQSLPLHVSVCERRYRDVLLAIRKQRSRLVRIERRVNKKLNWLITSIVGLLLAALANLILGALS